MCDNITPASASQEMRLQMCTISLSLFGCFQALGFRAFFCTAKANICKHFTVPITHYLFHISWFLNQEARKYSILIFVSLFSFSFRRQFIEQFFGHPSPCTFLCRPTIKIIDMVLYFYQQSPFLLSTTQGIQQWPMEWIKVGPEVKARGRQLYCNLTWHFFS